MLVRNSKLFFKSRLIVSSKTWSSSHSKKLVPNGPGLKDFLVSADTLKLPGDADELVSNKIFLKNYNYTNLEEDTSLETKRKVFFEVHGCQMNINDTEVAYSILNKSGLYERTLDEKQADVVLIMTCSIRENSEQKIWNRLKDFCSIKRKKPSVQIGILGCMAERLKDKIVNKEKMVDLVCGPDSYRLLPNLLDQSRKTGNAAMNVQLSFEETYAEITPLRINENNKTAFVSIQRGCDNMCSFCIVPFVRGRERSRPMASIIDEIRSLSDQGIKEVTLLGQNVNSYQDLSEIKFGLSNESNESGLQLSKGFKTVYKRKVGGRRFTDLLDRVSDINPEMRIRFTSPHPKDFPDDLLALMKSKANIAKTIHLPAQSGNSACLERMRRGYTREAYVDLVNKIREIIPDIAFTSDLIAGFCGESDEEHKDTIDLMNFVKYTFCFMYTYSMREKTRAYHRLADDVPNEVKQRRYLEMVDTFRRVALELNKTKLNQTHLVLIDKMSKRSVDDFSGRNDNNTIVHFKKMELPFIRNLDDFNILTTNGNQVDLSIRRQIPKIGDFVACKLTSCTSQSFNSQPLFLCNLQTFNDLKNASLIC